MDFSKKALDRFLDTVGAQGLVNTNTVVGWKAAVSRILQDLSGVEEGDVRKIDVPTAVRKFHNKNPGVLKPDSLREYQRRVERVVAEFIKYTEDPAGYKPPGRGVPSTRTDSGPRTPDRGTTKRPRASENETAPSRGAEELPVVAVGGLTLSFPLRPDFLAQLVIPRDLKFDEAKRLSAFVQTLAVDFKPGV